MHVRLRKPIQNMADFNLVLPLEEFLADHRKLAICFYTQQDHDEIVGLAFLMGVELPQNRGVKCIDYTAEDSGAYTLSLVNNQYFFDQRDHIWKSTPFG